MTHVDSIISGADTLQEQLRSVHRLKGETLADSLQKGRRFLPRKVVRDGMIVAEAVDQLGHPALERMVDADAVQAAQARVSEYLSSVNVWDLRVGRLLSIAGIVAFNLIVAAGLFVGWMVWSGQL